ADQDRLAVALRPARQVQPADPNRGGARRLGALRGAFRTQKLSGSIWPAAPALTARAARDSLVPMIVLYEMRRRARALVAPLLGAALTGYFVYHIFEGERGLYAWRD